MLQNLSLESCSIRNKQKYSLILTDMFIFGVCFTQSQFLYEIFNRAFVEGNGVEFGLAYLAHYFEVLMKGGILLPKSQIKLAIIVEEFVKKV